MNKSMRNRAGFTLVELTVVVVISTLAMMAIYQSLITQERTYRYQSAAIDAQGTSRMALSVIASELREISASAGDAPATTGGSDLLAAASDSIRFRSFRKAGLVCTANAISLFVDVWLLGEAFAPGDSIFVFLEGDTIMDADDRWIDAQVTTAASQAVTSACRTAWPDYGTQSLTGIDQVNLDSLETGGIIRSYRTVTYRPIQHEGDWVLGRRIANGRVVPLVGPILPPEQGGIRFRYFNRSGNEITPTSEAERATVTRVHVSVKALSRGRGPNNSNWVDSLSTNVYLRGN